MAATGFVSGSAAQGFQAFAAQRSAAPSNLQAMARTATTKDKALAVAQDFEAVFLNSMFSQMFTAIDGEGPFGGGPAVGVWRSFLTQEYAKTFASKGGIGIADHVYQTLLAQQEARS